MGQRHKRGAKEEELKSRLLCALLWAQKHCPSQAGTAWLFVCHGNPRLCLSGPRSSSKQLPPGTIPALSGTRLSTRLDSPRVQTGLGSPVSPPPLQRQKAFHCRSTTAASGNNSGPLCPALPGYRGTKYQGNPSKELQNASSSCRVSSDDTMSPLTAFLSVLVQTESGTRKKRRSHFDKNKRINVPRTQQIVSERNLPIIKTIEKQSSVFLLPR